MPDGGGTAYGANVHGRSALIVDADADAAAALASLLENQGMTACAVAAVEDAFREAEDAPFDVVVVNPGVGSSADELTGIIRRFVETPVVVTSSGGTKRAVEAIRAGAADFMDKPCNKDEVLRVLDKVLASRVSIPLGRQPRSCPSPACWEIPKRCVVYST